MVKRVSMLLLLLLLYCNYCFRYDLGKHGVTPSDVNDLCYFIHEYCPALYLSGLMTIGAPNRELNENEVNPDFEASSKLIIHYNSYCH